MKKVFSITLVALMAAGVAPVLAQGADVNAQAGAPQAPGFAKQGGRGGSKHGMSKRGGAMGEKRGFMGGRLMQMLSADQKAQFKSIMQSNREQGKALHDKMRAIREANQGKSNLDAASKAELMALRKQMKAHREGMDAKIASILTPEQKVVFEQQRAEREKRFAEFGGKRGGGKGRMGRGPGRFGGAGGPRGLGAGFGGFGGGPAL